VGLKRLRADAFFSFDDIARTIPLCRELVASIATMHWMKREDAWDLRIRLAWALDQTQQTRPEAIAILDAVVSEQLAAHTENTPVAAFALSILSLAECHADTPRPAREHAEKALGIYRTIYGDRHIQVAHALTLSASAEVQDGSAKLAIEHYREAQRIFEANSVRDDWYFNIEQGLGVAYDDGLHDSKTAESHFRAALSAFRKIFGDDHTSTLQAEISLACVLIEQGRYDEAEPLLQDVLRRSEEAMPSLQQPEVAKTVQAVIALVRHAQGRDQEARELLQSSVSTVQWEPMQSRAILQRVRALAKALHVSGDSVEAQEAAPRG
jgi:tetratricopeptide (TPR) repeat protein